MLERLKAAGYHIYYLSNYSRKAIRDCPGAIAFLPLMDGGIFSCNVGLIKPEPAIYRLLMETYGLVPSETVFLDDRQENVDGALRVGMQAIRYESREQAEQALREMGVVY